MGALGLIQRAFPIGVVLLSGLWVCRRLPWLGAVLFVAGAAAMGYVMYWTIFFPALAALVAALGVLRAWRFAHEPRSAA